MAFEGVESLHPHLAIRTDPVVDFSQRPGTQPVVAPLSVGPDLYEAGVPQHLQVLGHTGLRDGDANDELADRLLAGAQGLEDLAAARVGEGLERSCHVSNITQQEYIVKTRRHVAEEG